MALSKHRYFMDLRHFLDEFHSISLADFELLAAQVRTRSFKKGEHLIVPGQTQKDLFIVKSGVQMLYCHTDKKAPIIAFTYAPNLCAIPETFSFQKPSKYYLTCLTDSEIDCLSYHDLQTLFDRSQQIERLFRKMIEAVLARFMDRYIEMRSTTIEDRFKSFCNRSPQLLQIVPHKYISSYLGIDPTNFSKLFNSVKF